MSTVYAENAIDEALSFWQQGYQCQTEGNLEEAIRLYRRSLETHPTAEAHTFLGWAFHSQGRTLEAIRECKRAIEVDPTYGNSWNDIGAYLIDLGRLNEAIPYLRQALRAERYECRYFPYFNLGRIFERQGDWRRAIECYREALRLHTNFASAQRRIWRLQALMN
ncbi:MAG: tetratricopeptide repeat protein [Armatimonadetes bacterium]|nr:tetratricopeptide repeat protein [Armatimonadota bacterium]